MNAAKAEKLRRMKDEKYRYFVPTGKGEEFINAVGSGKYLVSLLSAANGIGKTHLSINMIAHLMMPCGNPFFDNPLWNDWPFLKRGRIVSGPTNIKMNIVPELKKILPAGSFTCTKGGKAYDSRWVLANGWTFDIMTYEQDAEEFESVNLGWIWCDEPPTFAIYKACISRLRLGGIMFITATPLDGSRWMHEEIIANETNEASYRYFLEADVWSASVEKGVRGFLTTDAIDKMIAQYDDEDKQARVFGKFQHLIGRVFKKFNKEIHVIEDFPLNASSFTLYESLDSHARTNDAFLWCAVDEYGRVFVVGEKWCGDEIQDMCIDVKQKIAGMGLGVYSRIADPSIFIEDKRTGRSLSDDYSKHGLNYQVATKARSESDRKIREALNFKVKEDGTLKEAPQLFIFASCVRTIWEIEGYVWDNWKGKTADNKDKKQKPVDKDDHMIEALGRLLFMGMRHYPIEAQPEAFLPFALREEQPDTSNSFDVYE